MWQQEDNTYNDIREKSIRQWLEEMSKHDDIAVRGGVKVTLDYIDELKGQIESLKNKDSMKGTYLKKLSQQLRDR